MARYVIGDVQGCFAELQALLAKIGYSPECDRLYLVGDLVNRGPDSLAVLRWAMQERSHVATVLGNHDLHLLACHYGAADLREGDTLDETLGAPDVGDLLNWLRCQPLIIPLDDALIVHAGILPAWDEARALDLAEEVSTTLSGQHYMTFFAQMYGNKPRAWRNDLLPVERMRLAVNAFTRMRLVDTEGALDFKFKGELDNAPKGLHPWFDHPHRKLQCRRIVCGHWSALGVMLRDDVWSLDSGCVWGGKLSAICLDDGRLFQVDAQRIYQTLEE